MTTLLPPSELTAPPLAATNMAMIRGFFILLVFQLVGDRRGQRIVTADNDVMLHSLIRH